MPIVLIGLKNVIKCKIACSLMADWLIYVKLSVTQICNNEVKNRY